MYICSYFIIMKIIHTYLPTKNGAGINKLYMYSVALSVLLAKRYHEKVVIYTNDEFGDIIKKIGLPYDEINTTILDGVECDTFSIPKLMVYAVQDEPYIHIDLDSFMYEKFDFFDDDVVHCAYGENFNGVIDSNGELNNFYNTYIDSTVQLKDKLPKEFLKHIKFNDVPNMSLFGVVDYEIVKKASKYCLNIYKNNTEFFDSNYYYACVIEQLFIPAAIRMLKEERKDKKDLRINFQMDEPNSITFIENQFEYPFNINTGNEKVYVSGDWELFKNIMYNFGGYLHLNGFKNFDKIVFIIKQRIMSDFNGYDYIDVINKLFDEEVECDGLTKSYFQHLSHHFQKMNNNTIIKKSLM